jgi:hypothetical protein
MKRKRTGQEFRAIDKKKSKSFGLEVPSLTHLKPGYMNPRSKYYRGEYYAKG